MMNLIILLNTLFIMVNLSIATYNSYGHAPDRIEVIKKLCITHPIVMVQEHWLGSKGEAWLEDQVKTHLCHFISAMSDDDIKGPGRGFGGCAILHNEPARRLLTTPFNFKITQCTDFLPKSNDFE